jgi:hypothetical protein
MSMRDLLERWRAEAARLERFAPAAAVAFADCARELEDALRAADDEPLTLEQGAAESGFSKDHLRHLIGSGAIANAGRRHAPRIRRGDLPRKAKRRVGRYDVEADARQLINRSLTEAHNG